MEDDARPRAPLAAHACRSRYSRVRSYHTPTSGRPSVTAWIHRTPGQSAARRTSPAFVACPARYTSRAYSASSSRIGMSVDRRSQ